MARFYKIPETQGISFKKFQNLSGRKIFRAKEYTLSDKTMSDESDEIFNTCISQNILFVLKKLFFSKIYFEK